MAVTSGQTSFEDFEAPGATFNNINSGAGAGDNQDVFIEGSQSGSRRVDNVTDKGFMATVTAVDLSGAGEHVKIWVACNQWPSVTGLTARVLSGTNNYDNHEFGTTPIPTTGGWIPLWFDVSRTADSTGSSGAANEASITDIGAYIDIGNVTGAADNFFIDKITYGTDGLTWTGASGAMSDFRTFEDTNSEGNLIERDGVDFVFSRLTIGDSGVTSFSDSAFTVVFPEQALVATTFMGITCDIQNASTSITFTTATIQSGDPTGATRRPDLLVTGTGGSFTLDTCVLNGLRTVQLNVDCTATDCTFLNCGVIDATNAGADGATLNGSTIIDSISAADAAMVLWDVNADPDGHLDDMVFDSTNSTNAIHAIEFGDTIPTSITLRNCDFSGFSASDSQNDSTFYFRDTAGTFTLNLIGVTGNVSVKTDGCTVNVVQNPVTLTINVSDVSTGAAINGARVYVLADSTGPLPYQDSVTITRSGSTATVTHTAHGLANGEKVLIEGADQDEYNGIKTISNVSTNAYDFTVSGTPTTPATGTIISTAVIISDTTNVSGVVSDTRTYSSDQDFTGRVRDSSSSPFYKTSVISGTISSTNGLTVNVPMILDE